MAESGKGIIKGEEEVTKCERAKVARVGESHRNYAIQRHCYYTLGHYFTLSQTTVRFSLKNKSFGDSSGKNELVMEIFTKIGLTERNVELEFFC